MDTLILYLLSVYACLFFLSVVCVYVCMCAFFLSFKVICEIYRFNLFLARKILTVVLVLFVYSV